MSLKYPLIMRLASIGKPQGTSTVSKHFCVLANEDPIERIFEGTIIREILLMSGFEFRPQRTRIPLLDAGNRSTVRGLHGSIRNIRVDGSRLVGELLFAGDEASQVLRTKVIEGHITDLSLLSQPLETTLVKQGQTYAGHEGPCHVVTRWYPLDASLTVAGSGSLVA